MLVERLPSREHEYSAKLQCHHSTKPKNEVATAAPRRPNHSAFVMTGFGLRAATAPPNTAATAEGTVIASRTESENMTQNADNVQITQRSLTSQIRHRKEIRAAGEGETGCTL